MIKVLIGSDNKILDFCGTDIELKTVDEVPDKPKPKLGVEYIAYYDDEQNGIVYKEVRRELTNEEKLMEQMKKIEKQQLSTMEVVATIVESQGSV